MAISWIWAGMVILSLFCGLYTGNLDDVASAALNGAQSAVELSFSMAGVLCLWSGVMEVLNACGLSQKIAGCFHPLLHRLLPQASQDSETLAAVSASDELCLLVVLNTASIQLLPTTVASIRSAYGSAAPFDILPAVWVSSLASVTVGLLTARFLSRRKRGHL